VLSKQRNVLLFGEGAAIDWGGPETKELTNLVLESGFATSSGSMTITKFIFLHLKNESTYAEKDLNLRRWLLPGSWYCARF
jgi:hypothetical protein